jgi:DNA invertase Pin-like site-specific DNA recombinase
VLAASYLRCSTEEQARGLSIEGQRDSVHAYAAAHDLEIVAEYADVGLSGSYDVDRRPELARMIRDAASGAWSVVLVWIEDRLARDNALAGWIEVELRRSRVQIVPVATPNASDLERDYHKVAAGEQLRLIRANTRRGLRAAWDRGRRLGAAPYGYRWERDEMVPDPLELAQVVALFDSAAAGVPLTQLDRRMEWHRGRTLWTLRNPAYAGGRAFGRKRKTLQRDYEIRWDTHPAAVSRDTWDAVQSRLDAQTWPASPHEGKLALAGLLHCRCGGRYAIASWWDSAKGRAFRWRCRACGDAVTGHGWTEAVITETVRWFVEEGLAEMMAAALRAAHDAGSELGAAEASVQQLRGARERLLDAITCGGVTDTRSLASRLEETQQRLAMAEVRLGAAKARSREAIPDASEIRAVLQEIAEAAPAGEVDYAAREWLHRALGAVEVQDGRNGRLVLSESLCDRRSSFRWGFGRPVRLVA